MNSKSGVRELIAVRFNEQELKRLREAAGEQGIGALARLVNGPSPENWINFEIPFVCMLGADEREEMEQFFVVNSTAKSVRTDLALDLLKQRAESQSQSHGNTRTSYKINAP